MPGQRRSARPGQAGRPDRTRRDRLRGAAVKEREANDGRELGRRCGPARGLSSAPPSRAWPVLSTSVWSGGKTKRYQIKGVAKVLLRSNTLKKYCFRNKGGVEKTGKGIEKVDGYRV